jgi:hypothetical protein
MKKNLLLFIGILLSPNSISSSLAYGTPNSNYNKVEEIKNTETNSKLSKNLIITSALSSIVIILLTVINYIWDQVGMIDNLDCFYNPAGMAVNCCRDDIRQSGLCPPFFDDMSLMISGVIPNQKSVTGLIIQFLLAVLSVLVVFIPSDSSNNLKICIKQGLISLFDLILGILVIVGEVTTVDAIISGLAGNNLQTSLGLIIGILLIIEGSLIATGIFIKEPFSSI